MANRLWNGVLLHLRRTALRSDGGGLTDGQLLERFLATREEAAFEALLRRHGAMVLGVCRRVLPNLHDAEDAFQATFLVLVHKAASVTARDSVGNWLYGVAYRTAQKARTAAARRRAKEKQMARPEARPAPDDPWQELRPLIDQELSQLPDKYREPIVLCDLEGHTRKEAARRLGCPEGTVSGRLARARVLLAKRLAQHGLALSAGAVAAALVQKAAAVGVPAPLAGSTVKAAALVAAGHVAAGVVSAPVLALTEGVLTTMFLSKVKLGLALVLAAGLLVAGRGICYTPAAGEPVKAAGSRTAPAVGTPAVQAPAADAPKQEEEKINLPRTPAPIQVLARIAPDGKLVIKMVGGHTIRLFNPGGPGPLRPGPGGLPGGAGGAGGAGGIRVGFAGAGPAQDVQSQTYNLDDVEVFDTKGKKLDKKEVIKRLKEETVALASLTGEKVDPLHLRLIKDGTLVFVLPLPKGGPGGGFPGQPLPPRAPGIVPPGNVLPVIPGVPTTAPKKL
jgi:RNA polymerase sigma factor (sigma-70 family)